MSILVVDIGTSSVRAVVIRPDASLDAVMAHNVLHLLEDRERAVADIHNMLRPGGVFVTSTACIGDMMLLLRLMLRNSIYLCRIFFLVLLLGD